MNAQDIYESQTGDKAPNHQIAYSEWFNRYVQWLEKQVEKFYQSKNGK